MYPIKSPIILFIESIATIAFSLESLPRKIPMIIPSISLKTNELKNYFFSFLLLFKIRLKS